MEGREAAGPRGGGTERRRDGGKRASGRKGDGTEEATEGRAGRLRSRGRAEAVRG